MARGCSSGYWGLGNGRMAEWGQPVGPCIQGCDWNTAWFLLGRFVPALSTVFVP